jgi:hypothetical protein
VSKDEHVQFKFNIALSAVSLHGSFPTEWQLLFHYFLGWFLEGDTDKSEGDALPKVYESVILIALSSYGEGPRDNNFRKQVCEKLRSSPFYSSISSEEQV